MDQFRHDLLLNMLCAGSAVKNGQEILEYLASDVCRGVDTAFASELRRRAIFKISKGQDTLNRCREQFHISYNPALRDQEDPLLEQASYAPDIAYVFEQEPDPTRRIPMFRARFDAFRGTTSADYSQQSLGCQYQLAIDEDQKEIHYAAAASLESTNLSTRSSAQRWQTAQRS